MIVDLTAQTAPGLWALAAALVLLALALFACIDPELAEVFFGEVQLLIATIALAVIVIVLFSVSVELPHALAG